VERFAFRGHGERDRIREKLDMRVEAG